MSTPLKAAFALLILLPLARGADREDRWRPLGRAEGLASEDVLDLCPAGDEAVWAATAAGVCRIEEYGIRLLLPGRAARRLAPAPRGDVFALYSDGVRRFGHLEARYPLPEDPAAGLPEGFGTGADGILRLRLRDRVYRLDPDGSWQREPEGASLDGPADPGLRDVPLPPGVHKAIRFGGEVWGATRGRGILRRRLEPRFRRIALPRARRVHALARAPGGALWCATERGVVRLDPDGRAEAFETAQGTVLGPATAIAIDRTGRVWLGSGSAFTGVFRFEQGRWRHLDAIDGHVHRITTDPSGALWFALLRPPGSDPALVPGAWVFTDGEFRPAPASVELPSARVYDVVARDPTGVLWFATLKGLAAYRGGGRVRRYGAGPGGLAGEKVWSLCAARDGSLWIGYQRERGVSRLARGRFRHFGVADGLCDGSVWTIVEGRPGVFWFATASGLARYDGRRWSCFRSEEGLGDAPIWPLLPDADGSLWIGTLGDGLLRLEPGDDAPPRTLPERTTVRATAGEEVRLRWRGTDRWYDTPADRLWFRDRVDGGAWSAAAPVTSRALRLATGEHRFEVQAIDRFGNVETTPAVVRILVGPGSGPGWWPLGAAFVALALLAVLTVRRYARRGS